MVPGTIALGGEQVGGAFVEAEEAGGVGVERCCEVIDVVGGAAIPAAEVRAEDKSVGAELVDGECELGVTGHMTVKPKTIDSGIKGSRLLDPVG